MACGSSPKKPHFRLVKYNIISYLIYTYIYIYTYKRTWHIYYSVYMCVRWFSHRWYTPLSIGDIPWHCRKAPADWHPKHMRQKQEISVQDVHAYTNMYSLHMHYTYSIYNCMLIWKLSHIIFKFMARLLRRKMCICLWLFCLLSFWSIFI